MKPVSQVVACVVDYGTFICVAERLAESMQTVYYYSPFEEEYQDVRECVRATGLSKVIRLDHPFDPAVFNTIDLFVFPDIGYEGLQKYLRSVGKAVWGSMGASELELYRDKFLATVKKVGLPVIPYEKVVGVQNLQDYLKNKSNKWIKINRYRGNVETWHWIDYENSINMMSSVQFIFGPAGKDAVFIVQDDLKSDIEVGYDGWCIDGEYPSLSFQGYEKKNELYLGSLLPNNQISEAITTVNEAMSPVLREYGYRCWWSTEIRVKDGKPYFIDPTARMPGQTGEHQTETLENFAEVVWSGANGIMIEPEYKWNFAAEGTMHYDLPSAHDMSILKEWKSVEFPQGVLPWIKLYHYFKDGNTFHFIHRSNDELGTILGVGDTIEEALTHLKGNLDELKKLPIHVDLAGFSDLLKCIHIAQSKGIYFADDVPDPESVYELVEA